MTEREKVLLSLLAAVHLELRGVVKQLAYVQGVSSQQVETIRQLKGGYTSWH